MISRFYKMDYQKMQKNNFFSILEQIKAKELYHVTFTKYIPIILKDGLLPLQKSNWVTQKSKKRYGNGEVYAFEKKSDAVRWAYKMDWGFFKEMGSGNVSIVRFDGSDQEWEVDEASPLEQAAAEGKWLKRESAVKPNKIIDYEQVKIK